MTAPRLSLRFSRKMTFSGNPVKMIQQSKISGFRSKPSSKVAMENDPSLDDFLIKTIRFPWQTIRLPDCM